MDDIILTADSDLAIHDFITLLSDKFSMEDFGPLHYFWGMEVCVRRQALLLTQTKYAVQLLHDYGFDRAKPISTPSPVFVYKAMKVICYRIPLNSASLSVFFGILP